MLIMVLSWNAGVVMTQSIRATGHKTQDSRKILREQDEDPGGRKVLI